MKNVNRLISSTIEFVSDFFSENNDGHGVDHTLRVYKMALKIGESFGNECDLEIVSLATLLHDVDDYKLADNQQGELQNAKSWLSKQNVDEKKQERIFNIITQVSFKGAMVDDSCDTIEACVVQDADRLDAIGCMGIVRTFMYGATHNRVFHDPRVKHNLHNSFDSYKKDGGETTINHFYEKLFLLKGRMKTEMGKAIAVERDRYMRDFIEKLLDEMDI